MGTPETSQMEEEAENSTHVSIAASFGHSTAERWYQWRRWPGTAQTTVRYE